MLDSVTLDQLRLFLCVAEEGSFSAAGRRLSRVQSTIGHGISSLEQSLGVQLFERAGRSTVLTGAGRALLPDVEKVFEQISRVQVRANEITSGVEPRVAVAIEAIVPGDFVLELCQSFRKKFASVSLHIRTEGLGGVASVVLDGTCALGISGDYDVSASPLRKRFLADLPIIPVAAPSHVLAQAKDPIPTASLRHQAQVVIAHARYGSGQTRGILSEITLNVVDAGTKLALIKATLGWGFVPAAAVRNEIKAGTLVKLHLEERGPRPFRLPIYSIVRTDVQLGPAAQWLLRKLGLLCRSSPLLDRRH